MPVKPGVIPQGGKWCPCCRRVKPADAETFYPIAVRWRPDGLSEYCRPCQRARKEAYRTSERGRAATAAYEATPRRKARRAALEKKRYHEKKAALAGMPQPPPTAAERLALRARHVRAWARKAKTAAAREKARRRLVETQVQLARLGWEPRPRRRAAS